MHRRAWGGHTLAPLTMSVVMAVTDCDEVLNLRSGSSGVEPATRSTTLVERDVEAPVVFQVTEVGPWNGQPSLGTFGSRIRM